MKKLISALLAMVLIVVIIPVVGVSAETEGMYTYTVSYNEATITKADPSISGDVIIPDTIGGYLVTKIGNEAFYKYQNITSIVIPDKVTVIGSSAFAGCTNLKNVYISYSMQTIGSYAFAGCSNITDVFYPRDSWNWSTISRFNNNTALTLARIHLEVSDYSTHYECYDTSYPTCTTDGKAFFSCSCGYTKEEITDQSLGHDSVCHEGKSPTCIESGWKAYDTCTRCDYNTYEELPATGIHTGGIPTCTAKAICDICYTEYGDIDSDNHDLIQHDSISPTCTEIGWDAYDTCSRCDYTTYNELPSNGHSPVYHSAKSPTCTEDGWEAYETCENCDYTTFVELRKHGHQYDLNICIHCGEREPIPYGDATGDGKINLADVSLMLKRIAKWDVTLDTDAADVTCDGKVNLSDVSLILKYIAKWDVVLGK